jgi:hypothetical protein
MSTNEKSDLLQPINPEQPQALSQSPVEPVPPEPVQQKLQGIEADAVPMMLVDPKCDKCFGRGFTGRYADGSVNPCVCTFKALRRRYVGAVRKATMSPGGAKQQSPEAPAPVQQEKSNG